jgi:hypothetical protein
MFIFHISILSCNLSLRTQGGECQSVCREFWLKSVVMEITVAETKHRLGNLWNLQNQIVAWCLSIYHFPTWNSAHTLAFFFLYWLSRLSILKVWLSSIASVVPGCKPRGPRFNSWCYQIFWVALGLEQDPLSLMRINEELLERKVAAPV